MSRIAYVNGQYVPHPQAFIHIEDRGYQFADGVYEVCELRGGFIVDESLHLARLERSLSELKIAMPMKLESLKLVMGFLIKKNRIKTGLIYLQVTRGVAPRDHGFPPANTQSALVMTVKPLSRTQRRMQRPKLGLPFVVCLIIAGVAWISKVYLYFQIFWPNNMARDNDAYEAWFVDDNGYVTEGSSTNAWIVTMEGTLVTRPADHKILRGITRTTLLQVASELGIKVEERPFTLEEAKSAREAFITCCINECLCQSFKLTRP